MSVSPHQACRQSITALVLTLVFVCLGTGRADEAKADTLTDAEFEACKTWHQKAGFAALHDLPLVKVATGGWASSGGKESNTYLIAFLVDKGSTETDPFEILMLSRKRVTMTPTPPEEKESRSVGFEVIDFEKWLHDYLAIISKKEETQPLDELFSPADIDDESSDLVNLTTLAQIGGNTPSTSATTSFHLAMLCEKKGYPGEARRIADKLKSRLRVAEDKEMPIVERLEREFGHVMMWEAVLACDDPSNPRAEILDRFERIVDLCPRSRHVDQARNLASRLRRMLKEDAEHALKRQKLPFEQLDREEKIKDLVFQLRDQDGAQWSQPGSCSIFSFNGEDDSPADQLVEYGFDAVPHLISALLDDSLTYSVGYHRNFYFSHHVLTVSDAARQTIEKITGANLPRPQRIRVFGEDPDVDPEKQWRETQQQAAIKWWSDFESKGERVYLINEVSDGGPSAGKLALRLLERYPDDALKAFKSGLARSSEEWAQYRLIWAIAKGDFEETDDILRRVVRENKFNMGTMAALEQLHERGADPELASGIALLNKPASWKTLDDFDDPLADELIEFLLEKGGVKARKAVLDNLSKTSLDQRVDIPLTLYSTINREDVNASESFAVAEEILVQLLGETERRTGMSGGVGELRFSDPRPCDLAAETLRTHWPDTYDFNFEGTTRIKDRHCINNANIWRKSHGKPLLESRERPTPSMSVDEFNTLIAKFSDLSQEAERIEFVKAVESRGIATLPHLVSFRKTVGNESANTIDRLIQDLGNRVGTIEIVPSDIDYPPVTEWKQRLLGKTLDGDAVVGLLSGFFKKASARNQPVRGIDFEANRHGDLSGIDVRIRLHPNERPGDPLDQWNGSETVTSDETELHSVGYGGGLSKDDPKESLDLKKGCDRALSSKPGTPCEIRWKLKGFWHD